MRNKITFILAVTLGGGLALAHADQQYQVGPGSVFTPAGQAPVGLSGTFTWADVVQVPNSNFASGFVLMLDATALDFQAGASSFRLHTSALNNCGTFLLPGPSVGSVSFCEVVDLFDGAGMLREGGLRITGVGGPSASEPGEYVFPSLAVYRHWGSPNQELAGQMAFSAIPVPEPGGCVVIMAGSAATLVQWRSRRWRSRRFAGGIEPENRS